ncbi:tetratricopeptide repeat protein [Sphingomonas crusticola]|uniref:tetratricopeptide repeat protein n=1 Tax=Sphingomonas crusticola TaxID=1697973 RepID=UPI000E27BC2B|nr:tetratricopeptide repeat protein [Sphingomonas crusticola]
MTRLRIVFAALLATAATSALAADPAPSLDQRVDRVERQLKAVQRKVFPGGDAAFQQPEIAAPEVQATTGTPASTPLNELTARLDALERSVAQLTGQVEQDEHRLDLLSQQAAQDRQEFTLRLKTLETAAAPPVSAATVAAEEEPIAASPPRSNVPVRGKPGAAIPDKAAAATAKPAAGKAVKPVPAAADDAADATTTTTAGADPAEDAYMAGYKLWTQKKYPQAEAMLAAVAKKYPKHKRASYAQNLLGRAYLDDGQPARAAEAFAANYTTNPRGERAPDSLYFLGQSLVALKKPTDACRVYDELNSAYGDKIDASLKAKVAAGRAAAKCK